MNLIRTDFLIVTSIALMAAIPLPSLAATREELLEEKVDALARQLEAVQAELKALKAQDAAKPPPAVPAPAPESTSSATPVGQPAANQGVVATVPSVLERATLFGYGEISYNRYDHDSSRTQADLDRAVFGIGYRFNEDTRFVSEFEVERAVSSADDVGEFEVEQFYIDHRLTDWASLKAGLILIPTGILNEVHEPPRYFGVLRNFVETAIIPTTEREGGFAVHGSFQNGLTYDVGLTTGFNVSNWDFSSNEGRESPFGSIHQELSNAKAADLAQYVALNYNGILGLNVGGSVFTGEAGQDQNVGVTASPRFTLWETHARYVRGPLQLQALYAHGGFSDTAALNLANAGSPTPIPKDFFGYYFQGAYRVWRNGDYALTPFVRYERFNTGSSYAAQPAGFGTPRLPTETVFTYGASFFVTPNIVLKADYQHFDVDKGSDRFNLGLGFQYY